MASCERGEMKPGLLVDLPLRKMRAMRFVFVSRAPYTTAKQLPDTSLRIIGST